MSASMEIVAPDQLDVKLEMTMSLDDWKKLRSQIISESWPVCTLTDEIRDLVRQVEKQYYPETEESES